MIGTAFYIMIKTMFNDTTLSTKNTISRFTTLAISGWLCIALTLCGMVIFSYLKLNFKTQFTTLNSYLAIYQHRFLLLSILMGFIILWLILCSFRCSSFHSSKAIKATALIIPITLLISLGWLSHSVYLLVTELNIPFGQGLFALRKYFSTFSQDVLLNAIATLPFQLNSIKIPIYGAIYSYSILCVMISVIPLSINVHLNKLWTILNSPIVVLFLIIIIFSVYYLIRNFIMHDPFEPYAYQLELFLSQ